jgi:putative serine protease PepD
VFRRIRYFLEMRSSPRHGAPPPAGERTWVHPSELPGSFDTVTLPSPRPTVARSLKVVVASGAAALLAAGGGLLAVSATSPAGATVGPHIAMSISSLPSRDQDAASAMLALVIYEDQHVGTATAMVLPPGDLAVTTTPIPIGATVEGWSPAHTWMSLTILGVDSKLGVTVLALPRMLTVTPTAPLEPATATGGTPTSLTALAAIPGATSAVEFEYAPAYLSATETPVSVGNAEIATTRGESLAGVISGTVILDGSGHAVAASLPTLGPSTFVTANFLELLSQRIVLGDAVGHGWLQLVGADTPSGDALVVSVTPHGASWGRVRSGDLIVAVDSQRVNSMADIGTFLYTSSPGEYATLTVLRAGRTINVTIRLAASP